MADLTLPGQRLRGVGWMAPLLEVAASGGALALVLRPRLQNLDAYTGSFDEGIRSQQLFLMSAGYRPFKDIFASQGPLLLDLLYPFFSAFGQTLSAARLGVVVCSVVALIGAWWIARQAAGPVGAFAAVAVLGLSRVFLEGSRLALAEVPTIAPSLLAIGAALAYGRWMDRRFLALSAVCCALALLIKPMALHVGAPLVMLLIAPWLHRRPGTPSAPDSPDLGSRATQALVDLVLYGVIVGAIGIVVVAALGPSQVWDNLGAYRTGAGRQFGAVWSTNLRLTANVMVQDQPGIYALALAGLLLGLWRRPALTLALVAWALAIVGLFAVYGDLADKHIVYLVPPVALLAALGVGLTVEVAAQVFPGLRPFAGLPPPDRSAPSALVPPSAAAGAHDYPYPNQPSSGSGMRAAHLAALAVGAVGIVGYLSFLPAVYHADQFLLREAPKIAAERRGKLIDEEIARIIQSRTPPDGWVLADNPGAAFEARRLVLPYLVDTSGTRIDAGSLTTRLATEQIQRYRPSVIVTWPRRLGKLDDLVRSLPSLGYRLERSYEIGWKVYVRD